MDRFLVVPKRVDQRLERLACAPSVKLLEVKPRAAVTVHEEGLALRDPPSSTHISVSASRMAGSRTPH